MATDRFAPRLDLPHAPVDASHVLLTRAELESLPEYSCSLPTGKRIGKRWRRCQPYGADRSRDDVWWMGEYAELDPPEPDTIAILWREVLVVEAKAG